MTNQDDLGFKPPYQSLIEALERNQDGAIELMKKAIELGANPRGLTLHNAQLKLLASADELLQAKQQAEALGYSSLAHALKGRKQTLVFPSVPDELKAAPPTHWIRPAGVEVIRMGGKDRTVRTPPVSVEKAMRMLKNLLPQMEDFCSTASEADIADLTDGFYTTSYEEFAQNLFRVNATDAGRSEEHSGASEEPEVDQRKPIGELILSYQFSLERWFKTQNDFSRMVKDAKQLTDPSYAEDAAMKDTIQEQESSDGSNNAECASVLVIPAFMEMAGIDFKDWIDYETDAPVLPTKGKDFLNRLRKLGLGVMLDEYSDAIPPKETAKV
jgi:hypothetical protein